MHSACQDRSDGLQTPFRDGGHIRFALMHRTAGFGWSSVVETRVAESPDIVSLTGKCKSGFQIAHNRDHGPVVRAEDPTPRHSPQ